VSCGCNGPGCDAWGCDGNYQPNGDTMKLYEHAAQIRDILEQVDEAVELDQDLEDRFDTGLGSFQNKVRATGAALLHAQRELANEADWNALVEVRHKRAKARVERLETYLGTQIKRSTLTSVASEANGIPFHWGFKTSKRVFVPTGLRVSELPKDCVRHVPATAEVDKVAVRKYLSDKELAPQLPAGCALVEHYRAKVA